LYDYYVQVDDNAVSEGAKMHTEKRKFDHRFDYSIAPGVNPMIASCNATSSLVRFEIKNIFFHFEKTH
jgi:hypothetical protein